MPKLSDNQIGDRLHAALEVIGTDEGQTIRGNTAMPPLEPSQRRAPDRGGEKLRSPQHCHESTYCPAF